MKKHGSWGMGLVVAGLTVLAAPLQANANLVTNGGFESGTFSGWTERGDTAFNGVQCSGAGPSVYEGKCSAYFGPSTAGGIEQTVNFGSAGQEWQLSFALQSDGGDPNSFSVTFGGQTLLSLSNLVASDYKLYTFSGVATGASSTLAFSFFSPPAFLSLDAVTVSAVPEPATMALMGVGLAGLFLARRRKMV